MILIMQARVIITFFIMTGVGGFIYAWPKESVPGVFSTGIYAGHFSAMSVGLATEISYYIFLAIGGLFV